MSETRIVSVANRKGGVGKTTLSILLATALAVDKKKKVLLLDCDNQKSAHDFHQTEARGYDTPPPYQIETLAPRFLFDYLKIHRNSYDIIFIDMPRMTDDSQDSAIVQLLTYCDVILIPVVAGQFDALSTNDFLKTIKEIDAFKSDKGIPFQFAGFINKKNRRKDNEKALVFMERMGLPMFKNTLSDIKLFTMPSTFESVLVNKEGKDRFGDFFKEFCKTFKMK